VGDDPGLIPPDGHLEERVFPAEDPPDEDRVVEGVRSRKGV
jgi:hypothetical protein